MRVSKPTKTICKSRAVHDEYGCVELSSIKARYVELPGAMAAGCERMVHPSILGRPRARQRRFIGVMLAAPFFAAGAAVTLVVGHGRRCHRGRHLRGPLACAGSSPCWWRRPARWPWLLRSPWRWRACARQSHRRRRRAELPCRHARRGAAIRSLVDRRLAACCTVGAVSAAVAILAQPLAGILFPSRRAQIALALAGAVGLGAH